MNKRSVIEINLEVLQNNVLSLKEELDADTKILVVVKADAYGLGAERIAKAIESMSVDFMGVATMEEGKKLRDYGITIPILLFSEPSEKNISILLDHHITPTVYTYSFIDKLEKEVKTRKIKYPIHLKINTGLNRLGCEPEDSLLLMRKVEESSFLILEGVFTHLSHADIPCSPDTDEQVKLFKSKVIDLPKPRPLLHIANSFGLKYAAEAQLDMVRVGLRLYHNTITVKSNILFLKTVKKGSRVSYNGEYCAARDSVIATVGIGYADGIPSLWGNEGRVIICGKSYPIAGRVCMDMLMVDLGDNVDACQQNDEVILLGRQGDQEIKLNEISEKTGLNLREILCHFSKRIEKVYLEPSLFSER